MAIERIPNVQPATYTQPVRPALHKTTPEQQPQVKREPPKMPEQSPSASYSREASRQKTDAANVGSKFDVKI